MVFLLLWIGDQIFFFLTLLLLFLVLSLLSFWSFSLGKTIIWIWAWWVLLNSTTKKVNPAVFVRSVNTPEAYLMTMWVGFKKWSCVLSVFDCFVKCWRGTMLLNGVKWWFYVRSGPNLHSLIKPQAASLVSPIKTKKKKKKKGPRVGWSKSAN